MENKGNRSEDPMMLRESLGPRFVQLHRTQAIFDGEIRDDIMTVILQWIEQQQNLL